MTSGFVDTIKVDFSSETVEVRKQWNGPLKVLKLKTKNSIQTNSNKSYIHTNDPSEMKVNQDTPSKAWGNWLLADIPY